MKKHSQVVQILIFLLLMCFVIPPLFNTSVNLNSLPFQEWTFPITQFCFGIIFLIIYIFELYSSEQDKINALPLRAKSIYISFTILFTISLLFFNALVFKYLSFVIPSGAKDIPIVKPSIFLEYVFCLINFICSAIFEEVLYRAWLPELILSFFKIDDKKKIFNWIIELLVTLLFAFAHLYAGWLSVANAIFAHIILRTIYIKTGNLYSNMISHSIYNVLILFVF